MQDLTTGSISKHLLSTASFMLVTMVFQTLYFLVDLYWVGSLGKEAVAGVGVAGNLTFIVLAVTQMLAVGTTTLISHAVGQKNGPRALLVFNQSQVLAALAGLLFFVVSMATRTAYAQSLSADAVTAQLAGDYLFYYLPLYVDDSKTNCRSFWCYTISNGRYSLCRVRNRFCKKAGRKIAGSQRIIIKSQEFFNFCQAFF